MLSLLLRLYLLIVLICSMLTCCVWCSHGSGGGHTGVVFSSYSYCHPSYSHCWSVVPSLLSLLLLLRLLIPSLLLTLTTLILTLALTLTLTLTLPLPLFLDSMNSELNIYPISCWNQFVALPISLRPTGADTLCRYPVTAHMCACAASLPSGPWSGK